MKTILATVVLAVLAVAPAAASEVTYALRGAETAAPAQAAPKVGEAVPAAEAVTGKKVRVILASPYGH